MRITDIQRCEVRPGRLVEWTLSPATVAAATALPEDSRPPAYIQESHIRTAKCVRETGLFVPTWLGTAFDLPGPVDLDALERALHAWTLRHETLRSGFRWKGEELCRFTLDAADVSLHREEAGHFPDAAGLVRHLQDRFDTVADALRWPNLIYTAVVRDDGASVYMAFDHSNVDAYSLHRIPAEIQELYAAGPAGTEPGGPAPAASYIDFCEIERAGADGIDGRHAIVDRWREFIRRCDGTLPAFPVDLGLTPGGPLPRQQMLCEPLADADAAAAFEAYCRPYGGSLVGVLAATGLIVHELGGQPVYRTVVPFHTRVKSRWTDSVGWYVGGAPIEVPVGRTRGFPEALRAVRAELQANRSLARMPLARVLRLLGSDFRPTSPDLHSIVSYVDARAFPGAERWSGLKAYGLMRVSYGDQVCVWVNRLPEGLWLASRYPDTDIAAKTMRLYVERLRDRVASVADGSLPAVS
ncbi:MULTISPECIES: condensation domain-containing protein [Streptomyces]|uniref:Condensation domain-containing protein n=2 Tax=Streptomyces TaxID=1883 RepID=A0ABS9JKX3_9ACTN|nr:MULTISPECIES: condensation domain-containing protein [Streptomyces]MYU29295.1 acyltransferase papA2 [Streptomyces sp. SID7810]CUW30347.1 Trehalose-2-sulfate acyltransferase papA2 [Streptomyces reticuli]MCG0066213.1 condensation domain-containing protein [Streptomyces tricolor]OYP16026.1 acyltransferase papA2 [Streptomyces sp. FBKL.4005]BCM68704.1 non-ribosomal peptide synthase [Streptomyces sp. EAS-AB2608]